MANINSFLGRQPDNLALPQNMAMRPVATAVRLIATIRARNASKQAAR
jgi:hypothetical protein